MSQVKFNFCLKYFNLKPWAKVLRHTLIPLSHPMNKVGITYPEFFSKVQLCLGWDKEWGAQNYKKS